MRHTPKLLTKSMPPSTGQTQRELAYSGNPVRDCTRCVLSEVVTRDATPGEQIVIASQNPRVWNPSPSNGGSILKRLYMNTAPKRKSPNPRISTIELDRLFSPSTNVPLYPRLSHTSSKFFSTKTRKQVLFPNTRPKANVRSIIPSLIAPHIPG